MRDQRHNALLLQPVQGLPDKMRLVGGGKFQQQIGGIPHAQRPGVQLTQTGRENHLCPQLEVKLHGLPFQRGGQLFKRSLPLCRKGFHRGALAVEVAGEGDVPHTVLVFPAQQLQRDCGILCAVVDAGQNVTMQIRHSSASLLTGSGTLVLVAVGIVIIVGIAVCVAGALECLLHVVAGQHAAQHLDTGIL